MQGCLVLIMSVLGIQHSVSLPRYNIPAVLNLCVLHPYNAHQVFHCPVYLLEECSNCMDRPYRGLLTTKYAVLVDLDI